MHPNPAYRQVPRETNIAFARKRGFGVLTINADPAPLISHIPFLLSSDGAALEAHLVRSNPIARRLADGPVGARLAVSGPDGYISPDWYKIADQVPTWNYVAVHLSGHLRLLPDAELRPHLDRLSAYFETRLLPKPVWTSGKTDAGVMARLMRMIVPVRLEVDDIDATWKLAQNKDEAARLGAAAALDLLGQGDLARFMRAPPE